jgi:hypothetical protein
MQARKLKLALVSAALLGSLAASGAHAQSDTLWDDLYLKGLQRMTMMKMMDTDGDHKVTKAEFMHHSDMMFAQMDRNSDGDLDEDEWTTLIKLGQKH